MKFATLEKIARDLDTEIVYGKFEYWDCVPYIKNTAICFNTTANNNYSIEKDEEKFPKFVTKDYIKKAVEGDAVCLGFINYNNKPFCGRKKYTRFAAKGEY